MEGITFSDGTPLFEIDMQCTKPVRLGYQLVHQDTGRLLPTTKRNQLFTAWAATERMGKVATDIPTLDILEYVQKPVYDYECPDQCTLIKGKFD